MQVKSNAECSKGCILQYFRPSLSYHLSLRSLFCLFLTGRFTQVLLFYFIALELSGEKLHTQTDSPVQNQKMFRNNSFNLSPAKL